MIADLIHKVAGMTNGEEHRFYPRPSSAGPDRCIRQMVYHGLNVPREPLPGRAVVIFSDSSFHEDLTNDWIRKTTFRLHSEQMKVRCREPIKSGSCDGIITDLLEIDRLYEHKAINHFTFQKYWGGDLPNDYLAQCAVYMDGIQQTLQPDLKQGILLIKNKNTAQYMEFLLEYEFDTLRILERVLSTGEIEKMNMEIPHIVEQACEKFNQVLSLIESKTLPKRQYHINDDWQCEYCGWAVPCWKNYEQEFKELATEETPIEEMADTVRYYKETGAHKSDADKEHKKLGKIIKQALKDANTKKGRAGEYICEIRLYDRPKFDKSLLTPQEVEKATIPGFEERLYVNKIKEVEK